MKTSRRHFLGQAGLSAAGIGLSSFLNPAFAELAAENSKKMFFEISLAEFSFALSLMSGKMTHMEFPEMAVSEFGISNLEYVSGFFNGKVTDKAYMKELKERTEDLGARNILIMVDSEGMLGNTDKEARRKAVENHYKWVEAARYLGCYAIRINMDGKGEPGEILKAGAEGYADLIDFAGKAGISVLIENHIGVSTDPDWLVALLKQTDSPYAGSLPDFGNFTQMEMPENLSLDNLKDIKVIKEFDKYEGVRKLMPFAQGVSAKSHQFDEKGWEIETDFRKMLGIVKQYKTEKFKGYIGIESEGLFISQYMKKPGKYLSEMDGIMATRNLLQKIGGEL